MKIIDKTKKNTMFFCDLDNGKICRANGFIYLKIAECFLATGVDAYFDTYFHLDETNELREYSGSFNAFCLTTGDLTYVDEDEEVEFIECELHIV